MSLLAGGDGVVDGLVVLTGDLGLRCQLKLHTMWGVGERI